MRKKSDFLQDKRVIVTGGGGFLGSPVVEELTRRGIKDIVVPRKKDYDLTRLIDIKRMLFDATNMNEDGSKIVIIHLAALAGGIGANMKRPADFFYQNLIMGVQLMHEANRIGVAKFVAVGTVCSYPKLTPVPFKEHNLWEGYPEDTNAPYGLAKKMLLVQARAYREQYGLNAIYLIPVNLYGPRDNFHSETSHVIPAVIDKCLVAIDNKSRHIELWGTGSASREFLYVEDAARGIVDASEVYDGSLSVNMGSGTEISIADLAEKISSLSGYKGKIKWDASKPDGQPRRVLDVSRAIQFFGWKANVSLDEGLAKTIAWRRENR